MRRVCISKEWMFTSPDYEGMQKVDLPHDYVIKLPRDPNMRWGGNNGWHNGTSGNYVKYVKFDDTEHVILDVDGAYTCTKVYFNEDFLMMHPHGYTPLLVDVSDRIRHGRHNKIGIRVTNMQPSTRWYSGSGVYRDVFLWMGGTVRIEPRDAFITTQKVENGTAQLLLKVCVTSDISTAARLEILIRDTEQNEVVKRTVSFNAAVGKNEMEIPLEVIQAKLWDCENPNLHDLSIEVFAREERSDTTELRFGIRTISADAENGFRLNGKTVKLQGGCIHHDHAVLGAAEFPAAIRRKLSLLKDAGFNALRTAHNPPSSVFLDLCDELGILVMDEAFDMWNETKTPMDYGLWFRDWWQRDLQAMVLRERNHPCVISYSIGNEIVEQCGRSDGNMWAKKLAEEIRKFDNTRFVTGGICGVWNACDPNAPEDYKEDFMEGHHDLGYGGVETSWDKRTEKHIEPLDIVGYNYLFKRYEHDKVLYPNRVIWGSETHTLKFYDSWQSVMRNSHVIGDFTWTAYDNLGEAGTGRFAWGEEEYMSYITPVSYPWRSCYQGDFDLCGYRRPQSYFREAIWKDDTEPRIFTTHPKHNGDVFSGSCWHWYDVCETWTFDDSYIGEPVTTEVYTSADKVVFYLNGKEVATAIPEKGIARCEIPYEKGELKAVAYRQGREDKSFTLKTTGPAHKISVVPESDKVQGDNRDLCYFDITITDAEGNRITEADMEIECQVFNGELMGVFSGNPCNEDQYGSNKCHVQYGRAVAIVRSNMPGEKLHVYVKASGLKGGAWVIPVL